MSTLICSIFQSLVDEVCDDIFGHLSSMYLFVFGSLLLYSCWMTIVLSSQHFVYSVISVSLKRVYFRCAVFIWLKMTALSSHWRGYILMTAYTFSHVSGWLLFIPGLDRLFASTLVSPSMFSSCHMPLLWRTKTVCWRSLGWHFRLPTFCHRLFLGF